MREKKTIVNFVSEWKKITNKKTQRLLSLTNLISNGRRKNLFGEERKKRTEGEGKRALHLFPSSCLVFSLP